MQHNLPSTLQMCGASRLRLITFALFISTLLNIVYHTSATLLQTSLADNFYVGDVNLFGCPCSATPDGSWDANINCYCVAGVCDRMRIHGEACSSNAQCYSRNCTVSNSSPFVTSASPRVCIGLSEGAVCQISTTRTVRGEVDNACASGLFCRRAGAYDRTGICTKFVPIGGACGWREQFGEGCEPGSFCEIPPGTDLGTCKLMFSGEVDGSCFGSDESDDLFCPATSVCTGSICQGSPDTCTYDSDCPRVSAGCSTPGLKCLAVPPSVLNGTLCDEHYTALVQCLNKHGCPWTSGGSPLQSGTCKLQCRNEILRVSCCETPYAIPSGISCATLAYNPPANAFCRDNVKKNDKSEERICALCMVAIALGIVSAVGGVLVWRLGVRRTATVKLMSLMLFTAGFASVLTGLVVQLVTSASCDVCLFAIIFESPLVLVWILGSLFYRRALYGVATGTSGEYAMFGVEMQSGFKEENEDGAALRQNEDTQE